MSQAVKEPKPPFPPQHQKKPGLESELEPKPKYAAPLYKPATLHKWKTRLPQMQVREIADVNHYTIVIGEPGAGAVASVIREMLAG